MIINDIRRLMRLQSRYTSCVSVAFLSASKVPLPHPQETLSTKRTFYYNVAHTIPPLNTYSGPVSNATLKPRL
jgi:hypothetical protein